MTSVDLAAGPSGPRPKRLTAGRVGLYAFLVIAALFFLIPLYVMIITSLKPMSEIRLGNLFALPSDPSFYAWAKAWSSACTGLNCDGIHVGMLNSVKILIPSVIVSISVGAVTGYALSFWRPKGSNFLFAVLLLGAFIPYQVFLYPLVRMLSIVSLYNSIPGVRLRALDLRPAADDAAVPQFLRWHPDRPVQGGTRRWRRVLGDLPAADAAALDADHRRRRDPADHRHLERLPPSA